MNAFRAGHSCVGDYKPNVQAGKREDAYILIGARLGKIFGIAWYCNQVEENALLAKGCEGKFSTGRMGRSRFWLENKAGWRKVSHRRAPRRRRGAKADPSLRSG